MTETFIRTPGKAKSPRRPQINRSDDGTARAHWSDWSVSVESAVTNPPAITPAIDIARERMDAVAAACSRFDPDSELMQATRCAGRPIRITPICAGLVHDALQIAAETDGIVTPVMGQQLSACGYRLDISQVNIQNDGTFEVHPAASWTDLYLDDEYLLVPVGVVLDLGATAKASTADWIAERILTDTGAGAYVELGGDIATAGPEPDSGWQVLVRDLPGEPSDCIALHGRGGLATSSILHRRWKMGSRTAHHILDPGTGLPVQTPWRTVSVAASTCLTANAAATAAIVIGARSARPGQMPGPARFVGGNGDVIRLGGWPLPTEADT